MWKGIIKSLVNSNSPLIAELIFKKIGKSLNNLHPKTKLYKFLCSDKFADLMLETALTWGAWYEAKTGKPSKLKIEPKKMSWKSIK